MILKAFSVYDNKAAAYLSPFFAPTTGLATRMFEKAASDEAHDFHQYANDYVLYELGTFDQETGELNKLAQAINLGPAASYITKEN